MCSVTPDTILKWIKKGRLHATRTAGGHYRIHQNEISQLTQPGTAPRQPAPPLLANRQFQYCWEFNSDGGPITAECRDCLVYRTRAYRCFEVKKLAPEAGHSGIYCKDSCEVCDYFNRIHRDVNVLVVSDNEVLAAALRKEAEEYPVELAFTHCEYACSAMVETFRPDYAVVDCSLGAERSREFARNLIQDPRIPYVRVILAASVGEMPTDCDREIFASINTPFGVGDINDCIKGVEQAAAADSEGVA